MTPRVLKLGTRGSKLALAQAHAVKLQLEKLHPGQAVEIVPIKTSGDRGQREVLGAFVREIQQAILSGEVDAGLHCLKDLPVEDVPGLSFAAFLEREDPREAFIGADLMRLPPGAVVGTGSVRRTSQLRAVRPDLVFRPIMGNVDTRLGKLVAAEYDAIVLAVAGLKRMGWGNWPESPHGSLPLSVLSVETVLPAPAQAVLVIEVRSDDSVTQEACRGMHHAPTEVAARAERAFLKGFGGGCSVPVAALAEVPQDLRLEGLVAAPDGSKVLRGHSSGPAGDWQRVAQDLVDDLAAQGARSMFEPAPALAGGVEH